MPITLIHISAADPFRAGRNADLITGAVVANRSAGRVGAVAVIVARRHRVRAAGAAAGVNRVVPVVVVIGDDAIPAAILGLERVMGPAHAGILVRQ